MLSRRSTRSFDDSLTLELPAVVVAPGADTLAVPSSTATATAVITTMDDREATVDVVKSVVALQQVIAPRQMAPANFGQVMPGVYRSSFPQAEHIDFLKTLRLKTIVTLVQGDRAKELDAYMVQDGIEHILIDMKGTKKVEIPLDTITQVIQVLGDARHYPLMIHCNHGKHRTGCSIAILRKLMGWPVGDIIREYATYAGEKAREQDIEYMSKFQVSTLVLAWRPRQFWLWTSRPRLPLSRPTRRMAALVAVTAVALCLWISTVYYLFS